MVNTNLFYELANYLLNEEMSLAEFLDMIEIDDNASTEETLADLLKFIYEETEFNLSSLVAEMEFNTLSSHRDSQIRYDMDIEEE